MIRADFHTHTSYCDGKNSAEEMVLAAIEKGFTEYGFSEHGYTAFDLSYCLSEEKTEEYKKEIRALKEKYRDKIKIYLGIELDAYSDHEISEYEYVIGSCHYVMKDGVYRPIDESQKEVEEICREWYGGDYYALAEAYYSGVKRLADKKINIVGHIDLITKFNEGNKLFDMNDPRYLAAAKDAIDALLPLSVPFEINTGAISRGYRSEPYPAQNLIDYIKQKGGKLILSSDTHAAENIGFLFDEYESLI